MRHRHVRLEWTKSFVSAQYEGCNRETYKHIEARKSLLFSIHFMITDLVCKLQQKFDYISFCRSLYVNVWYSFDVTCIGKIFYLFLYIFRKG